MNDLQNWLINRLPSLLPCQVSEIISGTQKLSLEFGSLNGINDPLSLKVQSKKYTKNSVEDIITFSVAGIQLYYQFVKRLQKTPFFISSFANEDLNLYIIDFYEWIPTTIIYRIFYFQSFSKDITLQVKLPSKHKNPSRDVYNFNDWYFAHTASESKTIDGSTIELPISKDEAGQHIFVFSFSEKQPLLDNLSVSSLTTKLNHLESETLKYHILNDITIQDRKKQLIIDELWSWQKGLNPDRKFNNFQSDQEFFETDDFLWAFELCRYMGWDSSLDTKYKKKNQQLVKGSENNQNFFLETYFQEKNTSDDLIGVLQSWWDQYSLPLYRMKFLRELKANPSLIFIIYSLALQMHLPWAIELYRLSDFFYQNPQMALLAYLFQFLMIRNGGNNTTQIYSGPVAGGNVKKLRRAKTEYSFTRFTNTRYTTLCEGKTELLKIDKDVILNHNDKIDHIAIIPNIIPFDLKSLRTNNISIETDKCVYQVPLIWKKAEFSIPGCRIRWTFKKDRFQLTCQANKSITEIKIDNDVIDLATTRKARYYHQVKKSEYGGVFRLYDISGRSFLIIQERVKGNAQIIGWIQDRNGLLVDNLNIQINSRQIFCRYPESGLFHKSVTVSQDLDNIKVLAKKIHLNIPIKMVDNKSNIKLIRYSPIEDKGTIIVVIDDEFQTRKTEIQQQFLECLGFIPFILNRSEIKKSLITSPLIFIGNIDSPDKLKEKNKFSGVSLLTISTPDEIIKLFGILID